MSNLLKKIYAPQDLSLSGSFKASKRFSIGSYLPFWHFSKKAIAWINIVYDMGSIQLFWERLSKNVHVTILKGNMGYDQYTVPDTIAVEPTFVAFLSHSQTYVHGLSYPSFKILWTTVNSKPPTIPFRDCRMHLFWQTFSKQLYIFSVYLMMMARDWLNFPLEMSLLEDSYPPNYSLTTSIPNRQQKK